MHVTIERARWRCGGKGLASHGVGATKLKNEQGYLDVVGFIALACGMTEAAITGRRQADAVDPEHVTPAFAGLLLDRTRFGYVNNDLCGRIVELNDKGDFDRDYRASRLAEVLAREGVDLAFVDGTAPGEDGPAPAPAADVAVVASHVAAARREIGLSADFADDFPADDDLAGDNGGYDF